MIAQQGGTAVTARTECFEYPMWTLKTEACGRTAAGEFHGQRLAPSTRITELFNSAIYLDVWATGAPSRIRPWCREGGRRGTESGSLEDAKSRVIQSGRGWRDENLLLT